MEDLYHMRAVQTPGIIMETLYGLMAYSVSRRTREIGIRIAVGAGRGDVLGMVLRQGLKLTVTGTAIGVLLSVGAGRVLAAMFSGHGSIDPVATLALPLALLAITMLAAYVPARRAARVDPTVALRYE
jgi:ABC-type antimicrobial peptide transport system permease subunit